ncbi:hypothetical protein BCh11DRAFT_04526 [Burkholderia sp. Ch1-1]|uniref:Uncharacterized protein n=1 Tax=Paraburkholderia dioscoreae TaxID=2604047 RepID=A0A5Q4Z8C8_9BURK|nr:hypothetical protein BCh11DRAFT_04526 [Burkholderia sp. Ch1-1]VVD26497.1 conserved protein of unknown function [Paraburkholderia dioscoreae]
MAYDYMTRVGLNRPVDESEATRRIDVRKPVADEAADAYTVFSMNDVYLEVCDGSYPQVGWCLLAFLVGFPASHFLRICASLAKQHMATPCQLLSRSVFSAIALGSHQARALYRVFLAWRCRQAC